MIRTASCDRWRHDDEEVAYPTFELIQKHYERIKSRKPGFNNICVHKGLAPGPPDPRTGHPGDLPKAARDWPKLNFISYHSCIQPSFFFAETLDDIKSGKMRGGVPDIAWTTEYAQLVQNLPNCYAEIGTTWASSIVTFPTVAAHIMGQLMKFMGEDRIVFGSDSVWYGSPQWQIEALWRFQIPEELRKKYRLPGADRASQAQDPGSDLGEVVRHQGIGYGFVQAGAEGLRITNEPGAENASRVRPAQSGQHVPDEGDLRFAGDRTGSYPLRVDPRKGMSIGARGGAGSTGRHERIGRDLVDGITVFLDAGDPKGNWLPSVTCNCSRPADVVQSIPSEHNYRAA